MKRRRRCETRAASLPSGATQSRPVLLPSVPVTVAERVYQGVSTVWTVRDAAGARFTVYEQNERPFDESSRWTAGDRLFLCFHPRDAVLLRPEARE